MILLECYATFLLFRGVPSVKPTIAFGNEYDLYMGIKSFAKHYIDVYNNNKKHR